MAFSDQDVYENLDMYFESLHVGKFLSTYIKNSNISAEARSTQILFPNGKSYFLNGALIRDALSEAFINPHRSSSFGYFVTWNGFRGVTATIYEGLKSKGAFAKNVESVLGEKYQEFKTVVAFARHTLSHNIETEIRMSIAQFRPLMDRYYEKKRSHSVQFSFRYGDVNIFRGALPDDYGFDITFDFASIKEGDRFIDLISEYNLFMLCELCFNLARRLRP